jgi:hypothetical protein
MAEKRKYVDWDSIEQLYRAGTLSLSEICAQYEADHINSQVWKTTVTHVAIIKRAREKKWTRDLAGKVQTRVKEKLVTGLVTSKRKSDEEYVETAAEAGVNVVLRHQREIAALLDHENRLLDELEKGAKKLYVANYQGEIITKEMELTVKEKSATLKDLAAVRAQRVALERQAHNLDDSDTAATEEKVFRVKRVSPGEYLP